MMLLEPPRVAQVQDRFAPERPGPLVGPHVAQTGNGAVFVDRWPDPTALLAATADNLSLIGDPATVSSADLRAHVSDFVDAPESFVHLLRDAFPDLVIWDRVIYWLDGEVHDLPSTRADVRRLQAGDADHLWGLSRESAWIAKTWGGPPGLARSGIAWGAFADDQLVTVACVFFVGRHYEELGVATELAYRGRGLSTVYAQRLCRDIRARERRPSWTTSSDNAASIRVAEKLGFSLHRRDALYAVSVSLPPPSRSSGPPRDADQ